MPNSSTQGTTVDNPGVIAPPPLLYAGALGIGLAVDFLLFRLSTGIPASIRYALAALLLAAALALGISAMNLFRRAGTNAQPWRPTTTIVADGVYAFTRNPMYLATTLLYMAISIAADSAIALLLLIPLLIVMHYGVIVREERYLKAKFGDDYRRYKSTVRRW
jgi:protein-S-isoprenylcysteine O-methyltransferase Ste14